MNNLLSVEQLFADRFLQIPDYQRGYAWGEQQLDELLEDLDLLPAGKPHYTGTVVLHAAAGAPVLDEEGKSYGTFNVVDGQQRLTSLILLLDAIRRELLADGSAKLADGIRKTYISVPDGAGQPLYKLRLNSDCHSFFIDNVLADAPGPEGPAIFSHRKLGAAREHFEKHLARHRAALGAGFRTWLLELRTKVTQQLRLLVYVVADDTEVGVVFETMNNRGKQLTELEKVKNYLLYLTTKIDVANADVRPLQSAIHQTWAEVFKNLMAAGLEQEEDRLLRMHWTIAYNPRRQDWGNSKTIKAHFNLRDYREKHKSLLQDLTEYARGLRFASVAFCDILRPGRSEAFSAFKQSPQRAEMVRSSEKLGRLGVMAPFLPLLMAARLRFAADPDAYTELAKLCELFGFRVYSLLEKRSSTGLTGLWSMGHKLYRQQISVAEATDALRRHAMSYCPDERFREYLTGTDGWYKWKGLKYFLYEYEEHLATAAKAPVEVAWKVVEEMRLEDSIEHILPQTPTKSYWTTRFNAADRRAYTDSIGNLCLTLHNSSYGNKPFPDKKGSPGAENPCYANSSFFMERALAGYGDWTVANLLARKEAIETWALSRWHVDAAPDDAAGPVEADDDDATAPGETDDGDE